MREERGQSVLITEIEEDLTDDRVEKTLTNNKKFELFYDDMISIGLEPAQVKKNIN